MTIAKMTNLIQRRNPKKNLWFERIMALLATANLGLVIFDLSYIPFRDFWQQGKVQLFIKVGKFEQEIPPQALRILPVDVTQFYDWVKGIEANRDTAAYLRTVDELNQKINQINQLTPAVANLDNPKALPPEQRDRLLEDLRRLNAEKEQILKNLRQQSTDMIDGNPFQLANKTGTLEKIKNKMRSHIFRDETASSKQAFNTFWSTEYLGKTGERQELNFFDEQIRPMLATNYFRPIGENGLPADNFGLLDLPFAAIFFFEFLARSWYISRSRTGVSWLDAMLWRWYDILLFIPLFRWARIIPVVVRLNQAKLINLSKIQKQTSQGFVAGIAEDITEVVVVRIINQVQGSIRQGEFSRLLRNQSDREYLDLNNTNETLEIIRIVANLVVYEMMPKLRQDIEALVGHTVNKVLDQTPAYQGLKQLPGVGDLQKTLVTQVSHQLYQVLWDTLKAVIEKDPVFDELLEQLVGTLTKTMASEMRTQEDLERIESLMADLLEEIKVNYVERLSAEDVEDILEQTRALRQAVVEGK